METSLWWSGSTRQYENMDQCSCFIEPYLFTAFFKYVFPVFIKEDFWLTYPESSVEWNRIMKQCVEVELRKFEVGYRRLKEQRSCGECHSM